MELKVKRNELVKGLAKLQSIVERKTTMPILANILINASGKSLTLTATDLEIGMKYSLPAEVLREGSVTIHARSFYDIIKELPESLITVEVGSDYSIKITCGDAKFKIMGLTSTDFPALPKVGKGEFQSIHSNDLKEMLDKTAFAMSTDETRYNLNGVLFEQTTDGLKMVATDGHRLSIVERNIPVKWDIGTRTGVIIPKKGVSELKKILEDSESVDLLVSEKYAVARYEGVELIIRLIDGQFPPYSQVIPKTARKKATVSKDAICKSLKLVSVLAMERGRGVKFTFSPKNLELLSSNPDMGEARDMLEVDYKGETFDVGFNGKYFLDALSVLPDEKITFDLGDDTSPCVIRSETDKGFAHIIMPMRL
ncbi:MAG: DNA polymerase III subunit beta [Pseudomonadota bacterium]